jgi:chromosome segregation ATPase
MTLTREQVEWICSGSSAVKETLKQLADTDAALRQELEDVPTLRGDLGMLMTQLKERDSIIDQLRQRVEELEQKYKDVCSGWDTQYVTRLEQQVAYLTAKLAEAEKTMSGAWVSMGEKVKRIEELKAKLETVVQDYEASQHLADATSKEPT